MAGQYDPFPKEINMLMTAAQNVFEKLTQDHPTITRSEQMILTFTTVQLLKKWSSDETDDAGTSHFWDFIYIQYGFNPDETEVATQRIYSRFRSAIESTFTKRYMASEGHRFYSTMLLHALAPEQSIFNLYDVLFDFYIKNLDYQYEPEDPIYTVSMTSSGLFAKGTTQEIYSGEFIHGNIDELRFEGKEILLVAALGITPSPASAYWK